MKTKRLYTAPAMKLVAVETEQMMAGSLDYNGSKPMSISEDETDAEGAAKRSSLWDDEE